MQLKALNIDLKPVMSKVSLPILLSSAAFIASVSIFVTDASSVCEAASLIKILAKCIEFYKMTLFKLFGHGINDPRALSKALSLLPVDAK